MDRMNKKDILNITSALRSAKSSQKNSTMPDAAYKKLASLLTTAIINSIGSKDPSIRDGARQISDIWISLSDGQKKLAIEMISGEQRK